MRIRTCAAFLVCSLALALPAFPQSRPADLVGTVKDESGGAVPGAVVMVRPAASGAATTAVTDDRGAYRVPGLPAGDYVVEASLPGFRSELVRITMVSGESRTLDLTVAIAPVAETVTVTRTDQELSVVPQAIDLVTQVELQGGQRRVSLAEGLRGVPGLFVHNRGNFSESFGVRLSLRAPVRGVGIGVRGVQMVQDGVPLTMADGTTQPTNIDLGSAGRIEVIRGPSAVLYGNAAGGVVTLTSEIPPARAVVLEPDLQFGSYGYQRQQVKVAGTSGRVGYLVNASRMETDGFRQHSHTEARQANMVVRAALSSSTDLRGVFNLFDMPFAESPSTASLDDARLRPRAVRQVAIDQGFGEASTQGQGGLTMEHRFATGQVLRATGWGMWRDVWNPIPGRVVDLWRTGGGFRSEFSGSTRGRAIPVTWIAGIDTSFQRDDSLEFVNEGVSAGGGRTRTGDRLVDQLEHVRSVAPFAQVSVALRPRWTVTGGIRYDNFRFEADDRLLTNGDQSGGRTLDAFSPTVGVTYAATPGLNLYGNVATAYETPTTQELSNRPTGEGGFNTELEPEDLVSYEGGVRGFVARWRLRFDVAGYVSTLKNALVQYQRDDEQDFYRNAGESSRRGLELLLDWRPAPRLTTRLSYTYQRFRFVRFVTDDGDYSGKREPGAPPQQLFASVSYDAWGLRTTADARWVDAYAANNANTFSNWAFTVVDLRFVWTRGDRWLGARPFLGIDNLLDERYNGSIVPNAFGNRFYEPSAGREVYGGLTFGIGK